MPDMDLGPLIKFLVGICCISVPLGLWKLVELASWLFHHAHVGWR